MNTKPTALVWFTGVISQYNLSDTNLDNLKINYSILRTLEEKYNLAFIVCVPSEEVKQQYLHLIKQWQLEHYTFVFLPYQFDFEAVLSNLIQQLPNATTFIDYSKVRLLKAAKQLKNENVIHVSQLMN